MIQRHLNADRLRFARVECFVVYCSYSLVQLVVPYWGLSFLTHHFYYLRVALNLNAAEETGISASD
jgi:hypothetical protein